MVLLLVKEVLHLYWAMFSALIFMTSRTWVPEVRGHAVTMLYSSVLCPVRAPGPYPCSGIELSWTEEERTQKTKGEIWWESSEAQRPGKKDLIFGGTFLPPSVLHLLQLPGLAPTLSQPEKEDSRMMLLMGPCYALWFCCCGAGAFSKLHTEVAGHF